MYKVKVIRKFCDEDGNLHQCYQIDDNKKFILDDKRQRIHVIKEMSSKAAKLGEQLGAVIVLEKPKPKAKATKHGKDTQ